MAPSQEESRTDDMNKDDELEQSLLTDRRSYLAGLAVLSSVSFGARQLNFGGDTKQGAENRRSSMKVGYGGVVVDSESVIGQKAVSVDQNEITAAQLATPMKLGTSLRGHLSEGEVEWYAFESVEGDTVEISIVREDRKGVIAVVLYDPAGNALDQRYVGSHRAAMLPETVDVTGTYTVQVVAIARGKGGYTLTVDVNGTATPTETLTSSPTLSETESPTPSPTPTETQPAPPTTTENSTPSPSPTLTESPTPTETSTSTETTTPTGTATPTETSTPSPTPSPTTTSTPTSTETPTLIPEDEYGLQGYGEYGFGGVI